jgi:hypothetical protein
VKGKNLPKEITKEKSLSETTIRGAEKKLL